MKDSKGMAADTVHKAIVNQEKVDEEIVRQSEDSLRRKELRNAIKKSLRPTPSKLSGYDGKLYGWFLDKLNGCAAYGAVDKSKMSLRALQVVDMHYCRGIPFEKVAELLFISLRTAVYDATGVIDYIIAHAPTGLLAAISKQSYKWILKGCPHCGCDLWWDEQGANQMPEGQWVGFMCSRRFWSNLEPVVKESERV